MTRLVDIAASPDLVAQACRGDDRARAQLYAALAPAAFGLIRRMIGSRPRQRTFSRTRMMTFYERLETSAARRRSGRGSARSRFPSASCTCARRGIAPGSTSIGWTWIARRRRRGERGPGQLGHRARADQLSATARTVVWLYEVEGYSHEEIARAFGRSVSFSKSQLARAHRRLREWFEPQAERQPCTPT